MVTLGSLTTVMVRHIPEADTGQARYCIDGRAGNGIVHSKVLHLPPLRIAKVLYLPREGRGSSGSGARDCPQEQDKDLANIGTTPRVVPSRR